MGILSRLFGSGGGASPPKDTRDLEERLAELEEKSDSDQPGYEGLYLNRAGDLCREAGDHQRALTYYGNAIDALLEDGQREAARGVANKIIRIHPEGVRTLCTLTWLDLASHHMATALTHLREYVDAAREGGREGMARDQILDMARVVPDKEFVDAAADALDLLAFADRAAEVRTGTLPEMNPIQDPEELAEVCLEAAVTSNTARSSEGSAA